MAAMAAGQRSGQASPPDSVPAVAPVPDALLTPPPPTSCSTLHQGHGRGVVEPYGPADGPRRLTHATNANSFGQ